MLVRMNLRIAKCLGVGSLFFLPGCGLFDKPPSPDLVGGELDKLASETAYGLEVGIDIQIFPHFMEELGYE